jgi:carboxyl-terminal processing protease
MFSKRESVLVAINLVLAASLLFGGNHVTSAQAGEASESNLYDELKVFTEVLAIVQKDYVKPVDGKGLVEGAIKGMLTTLDPHSGYLDPDYYQDLQVQTKGEFGGLGIEITVKDGLLMVVSPMEGSPAEKVGIKPGDVIIKIEGRYTKDFTLVDAVKKLRGPKGSTIKIAVQRKGHRDFIDYVLQRDVIQVKSVKFRYLGDGFGYIRISQFMEKTTDDILNALAKIREQNEGGDIKGLVIDMRNNPGGLLNQAVSVGDLFLKEGVIVYTDGRDPTQQQKFYAHERGTEPDYPIMVLVNGGSASASEIVAGAFKDHGRALVVGTQTFGKGSVQTIRALENGGALSLTTALYYTKSGRSLQALGVTPDIIVEQGVEPPAAQPVDGEPKSARPQIREGDLPGAIANPTEESPQKSEDPLRKINKTPVIDDGAINPETVDIQSWLARDKQFQRAFELLKTFNIFDKR